LLGEAELRMRMDVAADLGQLVEIVEDLGDHWHGGSGGLGSRGRKPPAYRLPAFPDSRFASGLVGLRCPARRVGLLPPQPPPLAGLRERKCQPRRQKTLPC